MSETVLLISFAGLVCLVALSGFSLAVKRE